MKNTCQIKFTGDKCFAIRITNNRHRIRVNYKIHDQHLNMSLTEFQSDVARILAAVAKGYADRNT